MASNSSRGKTFVLGNNGPSPNAYNGNHAPASGNTFQRQDLTPPTGQYISLVGGDVFAVPKDVACISEVSPELDGQPARHGVLGSLSAEFVIVECVISWGQTTNSFGDDFNEFALVQPLETVVGSPVEETSMSLPSCQISCATATRSCPVSSGWRLEHTCVSPKVAKNVKK